MNIAYFVNITNVQASICLTSIAVLHVRPSALAFADVCGGSSSPTSCLLPNLPELRRIQSWLVGIVLVSGSGGASALEECGKYSTAANAARQVSGPAAIGSATESMQSVLLPMVA